MDSILSKIIVFALALCFIIVWSASSDASRSKRVQKELLSQAQASSVYGVVTTSPADVTTAPVTSKTEMPIETAPTPETTEVTSAVEESTAAVTTDAAVTTEAMQTTEPEEIQNGDIVLLFGGDVNFDSAYSNFSGAGSAAACIESSLLDEMKSADIFMHGNIFALTDSTDSMKKAYVFKTAPENAVLFSELGTDIVSLANNHSLDFGEEGLSDTMTSLDGQKVAYVGAGLDEESAKAPYYIEIGGKRIAFTAAMRSERYPKTPEAIGENSGVVKMYDLENYLEIVREAAANADIVVAYAHWGAENTIWLEQEQLDGARALIDAGADIVVGAHSYTLQTAEYYNGKPIFYGLGELSGEGGLAKITLTEDGGLSAQIIPFNNKDGIATPLDGNALATKIEELNFVSSSGSISIDGSIAE